MAAQEDAYSVGRPMAGLRKALPHLLAHSRFRSRVRGLEIPQERPLSPTRLCSTSPLLLALRAVCVPDLFGPEHVILLSFVDHHAHGFALYSACQRPAATSGTRGRPSLGSPSILFHAPGRAALLYWLFGIARIDSQAVRLMEKAAQKVMGGLVDLTANH